MSEWQDKFDWESLMRCFGLGDTPQYVEKKFDPALDITTYELATIYKYTRFGFGSEGSTKFMPLQWLSLDPTIKRHFK